MNKHTSESGKPFHHEHVGTALLFVEFFRGDVAALFIERTCGDLGVDTHGSAAFRAYCVFCGAHYGGADSVAAVRGEGRKPADDIFSAGMEITARGCRNAVRIT